jgi:hypothetical protein
MRLDLDAIRRLGTSRLRRVGAFRPSAASALLNNQAGQPAQASWTLLLEELSLARSGFFIVQIGLATASMK